MSRIVTRIAKAMRLRGLIAQWRRDERGIAATEFAVIVPIMLVMFFGIVEMSSGLAVDRKVTLVARTLSDLTSQSISVADSDLTSFFTAGDLILWPYPTAPIVATITQLYVDPTTSKASVQWSKGDAPRTKNQIVTIPTALAVVNAAAGTGTYIIMSEVKYLYVPTIGYVMNKAGITMQETNYTRPRQSDCVKYNSSCAP